MNVIDNRHAQYIMLELNIDINLLIIISILIIFMKRIEINKDTGNMTIKIGLIIPSKS